LFLYLDLLLGSCALCECIDNDGATRARATSESVEIMSLLAIAIRGSNQYARQFLAEIRLFIN